MHKRAFNKQHIKQTKNKHKSISNPLTKIDCDIICYEKPIVPFLMWCLNNEVL